MTTVHVAKLILIKLNLSTQKTLETKMNHLSSNSKDRNRNSQYNRVPTNLESQGESGKVREFGWSGKVREKSGNFGWSQGKRRKEEKTRNK